MRIKDIKMKIRNFNLSNLKGIFVACLLFTYFANSTQAQTPENTMPTTEAEWAAKRALDLKKAEEAAKIPQITPFGLNTGNAPAGSIHVNRDATYQSMTPTQLVNSVFVKNGACALVDNVTTKIFGWSGSNGVSGNWSSGARGNRGLAYFTKGTSNFPIDRGLILSTGDVHEAEGTNASESALGGGLPYTQGVSGDADLQVILTKQSPGRLITNVGILEFDFIPTGSTMEFKYIFASEEYPEYVNSQYNDVFAFFVNPVSNPGAKVNIALLPNPQNPAIPEVSINNVNHGHYGSNQYTGSVGNPISNPLSYVKVPRGSADIEFDGRTIVLTARYTNMSPCTKYHLKLAIGNAGDNAYGSGVFLQAESFDAGQGLGIHGNSIEGVEHIFKGCNNNFFRITRTADAINTAATIQVTYPTTGGGLTNNATYYTQANGTALPTAINFAAGETYKDIYFRATNSAPHGSFFNVTLWCPCENMNIVANKQIHIYDQNQSTHTISVASACSSGANGQITVTGTGVPGMEYDFSRNNGTTWQTSTGGSYTYTGLTPGTYTILVQDHGSCVQYTNALTATVQNLNVSAGPNQAKCENTYTMAGSQYSAPAGETGVWSVVTSTPAGFPVSNIANTTQYNTNVTVPSNYTSVTLRWRITSPAGCNGQADVVLSRLTQAGAPTGPANTSICSGLSASLTATSSGITSPVYRWYSSQTSTSILHTGATYTPSPTSTTTYYVSVSGSSHCETATGSRRAVTVTVTPLATAAMITGPANTSVCSGSTASLTATSTGVTSPVYRWYSSQTSTTVLYTGATYTPTVTGTTTYYVSVSGSNYCENATGARKEVTVSMTSLATAANITGPANTTICSGTTASLTATSTGVTSPVYRWYTTATGTSPTYTGVTFTTPTLTSTTTYYVSVSGSNLCENATSTRRAVTVTVNPVAGTAQLTGPANTTICSGTTAALTATSTGVTSPVYRWYTTATGTSPTYTGATYTTPTLTNTTTSPTTTTYYVSVSGSNFCENATGSRRAVTVTVNPIPAVSSVAVTNVLCFGMSTGSLVITATNANSYSINNGSTWQTSNTFDNLPAGTYNIKVRNTTTGCEMATATQRSITQPTATLNLTNSSQTNVACNGGNTGSVTVSATGGTTPYQYRIGTGAWGSSPTFGGLAAGSYTIEVRDANGCTRTLSVTITESSTLTLSNSSQTNVSCFGGNNGSVTVSAAGGTPSYQYRIGSGAWGSSPTFGTLTSGTYTVEVRDSNGCTRTLSVTITQPTAALGLSNSSQTNVSCFGGNNGSVTVSASGGTAPYEYRIGTGSYGSSPTFGTLTVGSYTIGVRDSKGCTTTLTVNITQPAAALSLSNSSQTNVSCFGGNDASVTVSAAGGTAPYEYRIGTGAYGSSPTFGTLTVGSYTIGVRDSKGCTTTLSVTITQPAAALSLSNSSQTNVLCFGGNNGSVTVSASGGTAPYEYRIGTGAYGSSPTFGTLTVGSYTIGVRDSKGCTTTLSVTITEPAVVNFTTTDVNVLCNGGNTGSITVGATGGTTGGYQYRIDAGSWQSSNVFGGLTAGTYTIQVRDINGCLSATQQVIITEGSILLNASDISSPVACYNAPATVVIANSISGVSYRVYDAATGGTLVNSGTGNGGNLTINVGTLPESKTLYIETVSGTCVSVSRVPINIIVREEISYSDIRVRACPQNPINLSKYIDTAYFQSIVWTPSTMFNAGGINNGTILNATTLNPGQVYGIKYNITNSCISEERNLYLNIVSDGNFELDQKEVKICYEQASSLHLGQLFGIESTGTWTFDVPAAANYLKIATGSPYAGAAIFDGKSAWENNVGVLDGVNRKIKVTYKTATGGCMNGKEFSITIILTPDLLN